MPVGPFTSPVSVPVQSVNGQTGDITLDAADVGAAVAGNIGSHVVSFLAGQTAVTWTSMPSALTELGGVLTYRVYADLTDYTEARMLTRVGTAGSAGAAFRCQYSTDAGNSWNYLDHTSGPTVLIDGATAFMAGAWVTLNVAARAEVLLRPVGITGNGSTSPVFQRVQVEFR